MSPSHPFSSEKDSCLVGAQGLVKPSHICRLAVAALDAVATPHGRVVAKFNSVPARLGQRAVLPPARAGDVDGESLPAVADVSGFDGNTPTLEEVLDSWAAEMAGGDSDRHLD